MRRQKLRKAQETIRGMKMKGISMPDYKVHHMLLLVNWQALLAVKHLKSACLLICDLRLMFLKNIRDNPQSYFQAKTGHCLQHIVAISPYQHHIHNLQALYPVTALNSHGEMTLFFIITHRNAEWKLHFCHSPECLLTLLAPSWSGSCQGLDPCPSCICSPPIQKSHQMSMQPVPATPVFGSNEALLLLQDTALFQLLAMQIIFRSKISPAPLSRSP